MNLFYICSSIKYLVKVDVLREGWKLDFKIFEHCKTKILSLLVVMEFSFFSLSPEIIIKL